VCNLRIEIVTYYCTFVALPVPYMALRIMLYLKAFMFWLYRSAGPPELRDWTQMAESYDNLSNSVSIVIKLLTLVIPWRRFVFDKYGYHAG
jgi:hypothetical protein